MAKYRVFGYWTLRPSGNLMCLQTGVEAKPVVGNVYELVGGMFPGWQVEPTYPGLAPLPSMLVTEGSAVCLIELPAGPTSLVHVYKPNGACARASVVVTGCALSLQDAADLAAALQLAVALGKDAEEAA